MITHRKTKYWLGKFKKGTKIVLQSKDFPAGTVDSYLTQVGVCTGGLLGYDEDELRKKTIDYIEILTKPDKFETRYFISGYECVWKSQARLVFTDGSHPRKAALIDIFYSHSNKIPDEFLNGTFTIVNDFP